MIAREDNDSIAILRLSHGKASALDIELLRALDSELQGVDQSERRALVLTGTGNIFSAGVDLFRILEGGREYVESFLPVLTSTFRRLFELPLPVVAAVNGHAIAGGGILVECCDHRLLARGRGRIGFPELLVGVPFPPFAMEILRYAVPARSLQRLALFGETLAPDEALEAGLVDEIVEPENLLEIALERAGRLGSIPREVFAIAKQNLRHAALEHYAATSRLLEAEVRRAWTAPEAMERIRLYLDRTIGKG